MKKNKKIISLFITIITLLIVTTTKVNAANTISITSNTSKVVVGDTVTYTVKVSSNTGLVALQYNISYDSNHLSLTSGSPAGAPVFNKSTKTATYTFKFKAKSAGSNVYFTFNAYGASWDGDNEVKFPSATKNITVITQKQLEDSYSKNNNLASLGVENATLSPAFSPSVVSYTVNLPANTETIKITGQKADTRASVSGLGEHNVVDGNNTIKVIVTAENGATKTYTINAVVEELDPINVVVETKDYTVVRKAKLLDPPNSDFIPSTVKVNDIEVPSLTNDKLNLVVVGLKDTDGNIRLYTYDETNQTYTKYNQLSFKNLTLYIENKEVEDAKSKEKFLINEETINGYTKKDDEFYYFYGINLETGKENLYRYDADEETVQRVVMAVENKTVENKEKNTDDIKLYQYIILGLIGFIFLTYIIILINLLHKSKKSKKNAIITNEGKNSQTNNSLKVTKIEESSSKENNKVSEQEKDKLKKESQEELERINNEQNSDTNEMASSIDELLNSKDKKKKKKEKTEKKKKEKIDKKKTDENN